MQLLGEPQRHGPDERPETPRRERHVGLQQPVEGKQRLVEDHIVEVVGRQPGLLEAIGDGVAGEGRIVLAAAEPLLLGCGHDVSVDYQRGSGVVVEGGDPEDGGHREAITSRNGCSS